MSDRSGSGGSSVSSCEKPFSPPTTSQNAPARLWRSAMTVAGNQFTGPEPPHLPAGSHARHARGRFPRILGVSSRSLRLPEGPPDWTKSRTFVLAFQLTLSGSRPAVAFPLQTTSAKGTERHHTVPDSRWLAGGWGQGARDPTSRTGSGRDRDNTWDGIRIYRVAAAILDRSARSGMARCRLRADGESRVLASRTRSEGPPERRASKLARGSRSEPATH